MRLVLSTGERNTVIRTAATVGILVLVGSSNAHASLFDPPIVFQAGQGSNVVISDLNEDGVPDLVSLDRYGHSATTWLGAGDGTFVLRDQITTVYQPGDVAIADLDGDDHLDLAIVHHHPNNQIQVHLGDGTGDFNVSLTPFYANPSLVSIAWARFDAGPTVDLVVTESTTGNSKAHFFSGNGDGTFSDWGAYYIGDRTGTIETHDFDLDGFQDAAISLTNGNGVRILWGNGMGGFTVGALYQPPATPYLGPIDMADLDQDGYMDIVGVNNNSRRYGVFMNNGDRTLTVTAATIPASSLPGSVNLGDFTGDGYADAAFGDYAQGLIVLYEGDGNGGLTELTPRLSGSAAGRMANADLDGDGDIDLVAGGGNGTIAVYLNTTAPEIVVLASNKDTTLRKGKQNLNEGANEKARIRQSGNNRMAVSFDITGAPSSGLVNAWIELTIHPDDLPAQWGSSGRYLECLPIETSWIEGNGHHLDLPPAESDRGTGSGATWNCPDDDDISDQSADCPEQWKGAEFAWGPKTAPDELIENGQTGVVTFDVTLDVLAALGGGDFDGWTIKKVLEGASGNIRFYTKEGAAAAGDPDLAPRLILDYDGGSLAMGSVAPDLGNGLATRDATPSLSGIVRSAYPNPFSDRVQLEFAVGEDTSADLTVFDASGRLVRNLGRFAISPGSPNVTWDGKDDQGRKVASGVYFVKIATSTTSDRVVVVRR